MTFTAKLHIRRAIRLAIKRRGQSCTSVQAAERLQELAVDEDEWTVAVLMGVADVLEEVAR